MDYNYNNTETLEADHHFYPWYIKVMDIGEGIGTVVGLLANVLLLVLILAPPRLITLPNILLLQRAIADVIYLIPFPFIIYLRPAMNHQSPTTCRVLNTFKNLSVVANPALLVAFTLDSYLATYPHHHTLSSRRKTVMIVMSTLAWVLAAVLGVAAYILAYINYTHVCFLHHLVASFESLNIIWKVILVLVIPLVVVWVFVGLTLRRRSYETPSETSPEPKKEEMGAPNHRLLLGLASNFTVLQGIYVINQVLDVPLNSPFIGVSYFLSSLPHFERFIDAILVICLSEKLRQKVAAWLPNRRAPSEHINLLQ